MTAVDILWLLFELGINFFQGFAITWFLDRILTKKETAPRWTFFGCSLGYAFSLSSYLFLPMPPNDTWLIIVPLIFALFCFRNNLLLKLFWVIFSFLCLIGSSYLMIWLMESCFAIEFASLISNSNARIIFVLTSNLIVFTLYFIIPKVVKTRLERPLPLALFAVIMILLLFVGDAQLAIFYYQTEDTTFWSQLSGALLLLISILTVILYVIMSGYAHKAAEKEVLEAQIKQEMQRVEELNQVSESLHTLRHDLLNHLHIAADLIRQGKDIEGSHYLNNIESHILQIFSTGCPALDSALYLKQQEMQQRGIIFHALVEPLKSLPTTTYELCTIVTNLLTNAIEACDRFPSPPDDYAIKFSVHRNANMLFIECYNPVWEPSLRTEKDQFLSSKSDLGHGNGLTTISKILNRLDAQSSFTATNGTFKVLLVLPYYDEIDINLPHAEAIKKRNAARKRYIQSNSWWRRLFRIKR